MTFPIRAYQMSKASPNVAAVAALIADPSRAAMLSALLGGYSLPAGELARLARITPQTASSHLARLVEGGLLAVTKTGRHRYYSLRSKEVAQVLETLALIAPPQRLRSLKQGLEAQALCRARTCYDHLAGKLGVELTQAMLEHRFLCQYDEVFEATAEGIGWFARHEIYCEALQNKRRAFATACVDWSERKPHLAGALGAALAQHLFERKWLVRATDSRAVIVTEVGYVMFERELGLKLR